MSALLYRQALPEGQKCVISSCQKDAFGRCLHCSPGQFLCEEHIRTFHAEGRSLHYPEFWKVCYNNNDNSATGCFKCNKKCDLCKNFLKENKIFYSACTNRYYNIRQHLDCKSKNVIYLATCNKCKVQYVGSTSNEFKVRFRNHKSAMLTNKTTCELAVHFNKIEHQMSDFEFIVIETIVNESESEGHIDRRLLTREAFWCSQLCTLHPQGLNKRSEFNSKNRIRFN